VVAILEIFRLAARNGAVDRGEGYYDRCRRFDFFSSRRRHAASRRVAGGSGFFSFSRWEGVRRGEEGRRARIFWRPVVRCCQNSVIFWDAPVIDP